MRKSLNSGNKFYSAFLCVFVYFADFGNRITAAHVAEIRFAFDFVRIFEIEFERVIPRFRQKINELFKFAYFHDGVARTIEHYAESFVFHNYLIDILF